MYEGISNDIPVEAIVARNLGDEDWEDLCVSPVSADGCSRKATFEPERPSSFEPEPVTIKALTVTRKRFTR